MPTTLSLFPIIFLQMHSMVDSAEADYIPPSSDVGETNRLRFGLAAGIVAISIGCYVGVKTDFLPPPSRMFAYVVGLLVK